jgi:hypothetical protein
LSGGSATLSVTDKSQGRLGDDHQHTYGKKVPLHIVAASEQRAPSTAGAGRQRLPSNPLVRSG